MYLYHSDGALKSTINFLFPSVLLLLFAAEFVEIVHVHFHSTSTFLGLLGGWRRRLGFCILLVLPSRIPGTRCPQP